MPGYSQMQRAPPLRKAAGDSTAEQAANARVAAHDAATTDHGVLADALNDSPRTESLLQMRQAFDEGPHVQSQLALQRALNRTHAPEPNEGEPPPQEARSEPAQLVAMPGDADPLPKPVQKKPNATGLPDNLKAGVEHLSGLAMDDVRVHTNSPKPAAVQAHAYAQGADIHIAPGQEKHLPHEAWHVVQQKQGRVKPTLQMKGVAINDDAGLEREADAMGLRAAGMSTREQLTEQNESSRAGGAGAALQRKTDNLSVTINDAAHAAALPQQGGEVSPAAGNLTKSLNADFADNLKSPVKLTSAHMIAKKFGGSGDPANVKPWAETFEKPWTKNEEGAKALADKLTPPEKLEYMVSVSYDVVPSWIEEKYNQVSNDLAESAEKKWKSFRVNAKNIPHSVSMSYAVNPAKAGGDFKGTWAEADIIPTQTFNENSNLLVTKTQEQESEKEGLGLSLFD